MAGEIDTRGSGVYIPEINKRVPQQEVYAFMREHFAVEERGESIFENFSSLTGGKITNLDQLISAVSGRTKEGIAIYNVVESILYNAKHSRPNLPG